MSEFLAHWDFKTIGDFASRVRTKNIGGECQDPMTISAIDGLVSQRDYFNKIVASKNTEGYTLLHKNDFAYNKSYSDGYPVGAVRRLKTKDRGIVSPLYICFELDREQIDLQFADYLFDSDWFVQAIYGIAKEGARSHGLLNIGIEEFFSASLPIPPLSEQKKIATILSGIDSVISGYSRQLQHRRLLFSAFWNTEISDCVSRANLVQLGDVAIQSKKKGIGNLPIYSVSVERGMVVRDSLERSLISNLDPRENLYVSKGDFCYNMMRMWQGASGVAPEDCLVSPAYVVCRPSNAVLPEYLAITCRSNELIEKFRTSSRGLTSDRWRLYYEDFAKIEIPLPAIDEQIKITSRNKGILKTIRNLEKSLLKATKIKKSVSSDLLSGRKRVSV